MNAEEKEADACDSFVPPDLKNQKKWFSRGVNLSRDVEV